VFNPFAWQLLVTIGAMTAHFNRRGALSCSRPLLWIAAGYVLFAFLVAAPWTQVPGLQGTYLIPRELLGPMDKSYLSPWRLTHVLALGYLAFFLLSPQSRGLARAWAMGIGRCGRYSLEIFCLGTMLSFAGWVVFAEAGDGFVLQILVNLLGIGTLWGTAWALAQRGHGTSRITFAQSMRRHFADWRSQLQRV
jgi:hypothetical protein